MRWYFLCKEQGFFTTLINRPRVSKVDSEGVTAAGMKQAFSEKDGAKFTDPAKSSPDLACFVQRKLSVSRFHAGSCQRWNRGSAATSPVTRSVVKPSSRTTSKLLR